MTSKGLVEMFEGDSADMCAGKFPMGGASGGIKQSKIEAALKTEV
jgi:hypothetical protein